MKTLFSRWFKISFQRSELWELLRRNIQYTAQRSGFWLKGSNMIPSLLSRQEEPTQHQFVSVVPYRKHLYLRCTELSRLEITCDGLCIVSPHKELITWNNIKNKTDDCQSGLLQLQSAFQLACTYFVFLAVSASSSGAARERSEKQ